MAAPAFESQTAAPSKGVLAEIADFGEGIFHGAIENPLNAGIQVVNHVADVNLPELHLVDQKRINDSTGGWLGTMTGTALDVYALSKLTGGLGSYGVAGSALRMGAMGAIYSGVLTPTDGDSQHFWRDRFTNGAVGAFTMAGMGATAAALDSTGLFAVTAGRSLAGSITYGAASGAGAGFVSAEATALIKDGRLATGSELWNAEKSFIAFGALYGAAGYAYNRATNPAPQQFETYDGTTKVWSDRAGNPYRVQVNTDYKGGDMGATGFDNVKLTNGAWRTPYYSDHFMRGSGLDPAAAVTRAADGSVTINKSDPLNHVHKLGPDGQYSITSRRPAMDGTNNVVRDNLGLREFDQSGRLVRLQPPGDLTNYGGSVFRQDPRTGIELRYNEAGQVASAKVQTITAGGSPINFKALGADSYKVVGWEEPGTTWNGSIKVIPPATPLGTERLQFTPRTGQPFTYDGGASTDAVRIGVFGR